MRIIWMKDNEKPEDKIEGLGIVEGDDLESFGLDWQEHRDNPYCKALLIPKDIKWMIPDFFVYPTYEEHLAFTRFQLALWHYQDETTDKPLYMDGATSYEELRLLSVIPCIEAIFLNEAEFPHDENPGLLTVCAAVGDLDSIIRKYGT